MYAHTPCSIRDIGSMQTRNRVWKMNPSKTKAIKQCHDMCCVDAATRDSISEILVTCCAVSNTEHVIRQHTAGCKQSFGTLLHQPIVAVTAAMWLSVACLLSHVQGGALHLLRGSQVLVFASLLEKRH